MRKSYLLLFLAFIALFLFSGCAPTILGDNTRIGSQKLLKPLIGETSERNKYLSSLKYEMISKGESLTINIQTETGVCTANLKLDSMRKGSAFVPVIMESEPTLLYTGSWATDLSSECLKAIEKKGGSSLYAQVFEPDDDERTVILCTDQSYTMLGVPCNTSVIVFKAPVVEGVDD